MESTHKRQKRIRNIKLSYKDGIEVEVYFSSKKQFVPTVKGHRFVTRCRIVELKKDMPMPLIFEAYTVCDKSDTYDYYKGIVIAYNKARVQRSKFYQAIIDEYMQFKSLVDYDLEQIINNRLCKLKNKGE